MTVEVSSNSKNMRPCGVTSMSRTARRYSSAIFPIFSSGLRARWSRYARIGPGSLWRRGSGNGWLRVDDEKFVARRLLYLHPSLRTDHRGDSFGADG